MKTYLTVKELRKMQACPIGYRRFRKRFGNTATLKDVLRWVRFLRKPEWEAWLLAQNAELTRALLSIGADPHACNDYAAFTAETENRKEVLEILREAKAG